MGWQEKDGVSVSFWLSDSREGQGGGCAVGWLEATALVWIIWHGRLAAGMDSMQVQAIAQWLQYGSTVLVWRV